MLPGRTEGAVKQRLINVRHKGSGTAALRAYSAEFTPSGKCSPWSAEEDHTMIRAHKEGKTFEETAAMLGRTERAVGARWSLAKSGRYGTAALRAYVTECTPSESLSSWSVEEDQTLIQAHQEGHTYKEIAAMLPGRTEAAVESRWNYAKKGKRGTAPLLAYAAEYCKNE